MRCFIKSSYGRNFAQIEKSNSPVAFPVIGVIYFRKMARPELGPQERSPIKVPDGSFELLAQHKGIRHDPVVCEYLMLSPRSFTEKDTFRGALEKPSIRIDEERGCGCMDVLAVYTTATGGVKGVHAHVSPRDEADGLLVMTWDFEKTVFTSTRVESVEDFVEMMEVVRKVTADSPPQT